MKRTYLAGLPVVLVICAGCEARPTAQPAPQQQTLEEALTTLRLSDLCASAADRFWRRSELDKSPHTESAIKGRQGQVVDHRVDDFEYFSHYNVQARRCLVAIRDVTTSDRGITQFTEIYDGIDGGAMDGTYGRNPLASMRESAKDITDLTPTVTQIERGGKDVPVTPEAIAAFRDLMKK